MARMRTVKPALRTSRTVAQWRFEVRYFWVLLWGYLDDRGRGLDIPKAIAGDCFPLDDKITATTIERWLRLMATTKIDQDRDPPLCRYEVAGTRYIHSVYWDEHQRPNRPSPSRLSPCPIHEGLTESSDERLTDPSTEGALSPHTQELEGLRVRGFEGLSVAAEPLMPPPTPPPQNEPPLKCPKHTEDPDPPPCGRCRDARRAHERWHADRRKRLDAASRCRTHPGEIAANCRGCAAEAKGIA